MKTVCSFVAKFASVISWVLSCFDRVIFKGHLPISRAYEFENFVDYRCEHAPCRLREDARAGLVEPLGGARQALGPEVRPGLGVWDWRHRQGCLGQKAPAAHPITGGLVGILCVMEACRTFKLKPGQDRPCFVSRKVPQRVLYYYFIDRELGLMHVRLQTWAPFTCQVYANGHDFVAGN